MFFDNIWSCQYYAYEEILELYLFLRMFEFVLN